MASQIKFCILLSPYHIHNFNQYMEHNFQLTQGSAPAVPANTVFPTARVSDSRDA